jgi:signal transduction histidine kinase
VSERERAIPPDELPRVFDRYDRLSASVKLDGLGLGLYIARQLVESHGGHIWAESGPGAGSTCFFTVPAA